jgi:hypothetical protein
MDQTKRRRAGKIMKRFCHSEKKKGGCRGCPVVDMCKNMVIKGGGDHAGR